MPTDSIIVLAENGPRSGEGDSRIRWTKSVSALREALAGADLSLVMLALDPASPTLAEALRSCQSLRPGVPVWIVPDATVRETLDEPSPALRALLLRALGVTSQGPKTAARMEALTSLAGGVAHDLNNLLTAMRCYGEILHEELAETAPDLRDRTSEILLAAQRASLLSRQLLAFSGRATAHPERIDLRDWLPALESILRSILSEQITLDLPPPTDPLWVEADRNQLEQVLTHLVTNAREAMPNGGRVAVVAALCAPGARNDARLPAGDYAEIVVTDSGPGVAPQVRDRLFEPFVTTKPRGRGLGLGLGLATALMSIRKLGGEIVHQPGSPHGSVFRVLLPLSLSAAGNARGGGSVTQRGNGERILVVEDDSAIRTVATALLDAMGYRVEAVGSGAEALDRCRRSGDFPYEALLSDISMPGMSGYDLAREVADLQPGTAVILMSGYAGDPVVLEDTRRLGALFLEKPFSRESLSQRVAEALALRDQA